MAVSRQSPAISKEGVLDPKPVVSCNNGAGFYLGVSTRYTGKHMKIPTYLTEPQGKIKT